MKIATLFFSLVGVSAATYAAFLVYSSTNETKTPANTNSATSDITTNTNTQNTNVSSDTTNTNAHSLGLEDFPT